MQEGLKYKSVNTYSGWTAATRHKYETVTVKILKSSGKETFVERLPAEEKKEEKKEENKEGKKEDKKEGKKELLLGKDKVASESTEKKTKTKTPVGIRKKSINEE